MKFRDLKKVIESDLERAEAIRRLPLEQRRQHPDDPEGWSYRLMPKGILEGALAAAESVRGGDQEKILALCARVVLWLVCRYIYALRPSLKDSLLRIYERGDLTGATRRAMEAFERAEFGAKQFENLDWVTEQLTYLRGRGWYVDLIQLCRSTFLACSGMRELATGMARIPWTLVIEDNDRDPFHALTAWLSKLWATGALEDETLMRRLDLWVRRLPFVRAWSICLVGGKALAALSSIGIALMVLNLKGGVSAGGDGVLLAAGAGILAYVAQNLYRQLVLVGTVTALRWHYVASAAFLTLGGFMSLSALGREGVSANPRPVVLLTLAFAAAQLAFTFFSRHLRVKAEESLLEIEQKEALDAASVEDLMSEMENQLAEQEPESETAPAQISGREVELRDKTCAELRGIAAGLGVTGVSRLKKADLVAAILEREAENV